MGEGEDKADFDKIFADDKFSKREKKGHLLLQLQKTYLGDDRFKLDKDFGVEDEDVDKLPKNLLGALSTKETQDLITDKKQRHHTKGDVKVGEEHAYIVPVAQEMDNLDKTEYEWDAELDNNQVN